MQDSKYLCNLLGQLLITTFCSQNKIQNKIFLKKVTTKYINLKNNCFKSRKTEIISWVFGFEKKRKKADTWHLVERGNKAIGREL